MAIYFCANTLGPALLRIKKKKKNPIYFRARIPTLGQLTWMDMGTVANLTAPHHSVGPARIKDHKEHSDSEPHANLSDGSPSPDYSGNVGSERFPWENASHSLHAPVPSIAWHGLGTRLVWVE